VASELLFDISNIDESKRFATYEQVGSLLHQTGDMRHLDEIIWAREDYSAALGVKHVRENEFWVPGHIPGRPLLPGVIMIEAAAQLCSYMRQLKLGHGGFLAFTRCDECVFRGQVVPGETLYLLALEIDSNRRRFTSRTQGVVKDRLVFEAIITGMQI